MAERNIILTHSIDKLENFHKFWPSYQDKPKSYYLKAARTFLFGSILIFSPLSHLAKAISAPALEMDISEDIAVISSASGVYWIIMFYMMQNEPLRELFKHLSDFEIFGKPDNFDNECKRLNFASKMYCYYCYIGSIIYGLISLVQKEQCLENRKTENEICGASTTGWFPINLNHAPYTQILCCWVASAAMLMMGAAGIVGFTVYEVASHLAVRAQSLKNLLRKCFDDDNEAVQRKKLYFCVHYHIDIIENCKTFNTCYTKSMGVHVCMTALIFGCLGNQLLVKHSIPAMIHLGGWVIALYFVCMGGQILMDESEDIGNAAYESKWYNAHADLQKDIVLIILRSQRTIQLNGGGFAILSLPLFMAIVKTSYSYLTLLNGSSEE